MKPREAMIMKKVIKIIAALFSAIVILTFCSCKTKNNIDSVSTVPVSKDDSSNVDNTTQTLLRRISANSDLDTIERIMICEETCTSVSPLMDKQNFVFLQKYTFSHTKTDKRENWPDWLKTNSTLTITINTKTQGTYSLYLIGNGSIAIQEMCGDSETPEITYEFYTAKDEDVLKKENIKLTTNQ